MMRARKMTTRQERGSKEREREREGRGGRGREKEREREGSKETYRN